MGPPRGFEPRTYALRVRCSTPELRRPAPGGRSMLPTSSPPVLQALKIVENGSFCVMKVPFGDGQGARLTGMTTRFDRAMPSSVFTYTKTFLPVRRCHMNAPSSSTRIDAVPWM